MRNASLAAVSCAGTVCTAVGGFENRSGAGTTLAERRAGHGWVVQATPDVAGAIWSGLSGVSCATATACVAVGEYITAGGTAQAMAARWNGTGWALRSVPAPPGSMGTELSGVSCAPAGTCVAAGAFATATSQLTLAARWDGTSWQVTPTPDPAGAMGSGLAAISCGSALSCVAVGSYGAPAAGGSPAALAEAWNGMAWQLLSVPVPPPGQQSLPASALEAVSCATLTACTAVGGYSPGAGLAANLAESWNGTRWAIQRPPDPVGNIGSGLSGIACAAADRCEAAGTYYVQAPISFVGTAPFPGLALVQSWNGGRWAIQGARDLTGASMDSELNAVSCASPRACAAAGDYVTRTGMFAPLAERWTGRRWVMQAIRDPSANAESFLNGISCSAPAACTAVGYTVTFSGAIGSVALAERWNGTRWRTKSTPLPAHSPGDRLWAVSCLSARDCVAVGDYLRGGAPLAEVWNGVRWRPLAIASPKGTNLTAVSCAPGPQASRACTAVGSVSTQTIGPKGLPGPVIQTPFAARWNGTRWSRQAVPSPAPGGWLTGVSCAAARACTAVGVANTANGATVVAARTWNGTRWASAPAGNPAPAFDSSLAGVACTTPRACTAVGSYLAVTNVTVTLAMTS